MNSSYRLVLFWVRLICFDLFSVGNAIFYSNSDREQAGRNAKEFLGAVQRVKQHGHQNARLRDVVATKVGTDVEWFHSHLDNDIVPRPPSDPAPPHARKISRHAISQGLADAIGVSEFPSGRVSSARSNAELISLHAEENRPHQSTTAGSMPGVPIDLDTIESGLGMDRGQILPLSENHIQGQIDEVRFHDVNTQPAVSSLTSVCAISGGKSIWMRKFTRCKRRWRCCHDSLPTLSRAQSACERRVPQLLGCTVRQTQLRSRNWRRACDSR